MSAGSLSLTVDPAQAGRSALSVVSDAIPDVPTWALKELFVQKLVLRDGHLCGAGQTLEGGEALELSWDYLPRIERARLPGFEVLWRGAETLAVFKPAGVPTEPDRDGGSPLLRGAVLADLERRGEALRRPRVVHRLDKETSGIVLVALSHAAVVDLTAQLEARTVAKTYDAIVAGAPAEDSGQTDAPLGPGKRGRFRAVQEGQGKEASTAWSVVERFRRYAWLRAEPKTGRTHQIRVHLQELGHPILCDSLYGSPEPFLLSKIKRGSYQTGKRREERPLLTRLALHAAELRFLDPTTREPVHVTAPLPKDMSVALKQLRRHAPPH